MVYCRRCDRNFVHNRALWAHERDSSNHNICDSCDLDFTSWVGLKEHWVQSPRHNYCQSCAEHYEEYSDLIDHYNEEHHYCESCNKLFSNDYGLHEHYRQSTAHHYCVPCKRNFLSASNLNSHLNSSTHRPKDVLCPFRACGQSFVSRSALILHLEAGRCRSGVDRQTIKSFVRSYDKDHFITDPSRMLTYGDGGVESKYIATSASWNGSAYECFLCHSTYRSLKSLNQHLESPRHQEKIYFCPLSSCHTQFTTLSALCQHIESERCGVSRFKVVQNALDNIFGRVARITL
jgi:hypothetical protein